MWIINQSGEAINLTHAYKIKINATKVKNDFVWAIDAYFPSTVNGFSIDDDNSALWINTFKTLEEAEEYLDFIVKNLNK